MYIKVKRKLKGNSTNSKKNVANTHKKRRKSPNDIRKTSKAKKNHVSIIQLWLNSPNNANYNVYFNIGVSNV